MNNAGSEYGTASRAAEQILTLLASGGGRRLEDALGRIINSPVTWLADGLEGERWEVLQAIAAAPGFTRSEACLALLRHIAGCSGQPGQAGSHAGQNSPGALVRPPARAASQPVLPVT